MPPLTNFDYMIVGQGLAGSALAYQLIKKGKKILVFDEEKEQTSSKVAAGLFNPVTGRKMVKTWLADTLFPYLEAYYREIEDVCNTKLLYDIPIYRPFISMEEQNEWMGKSVSLEYNKFIKKVHCTSLYPFTNDHCGGLELSYSGFLNVPTYLVALRNFFKAHKAYVSNKFDYKKLIIGTNYVSYNEFTSKKIICCDGLAAGSNTYFSWLPFKPVKGEIVKIKMKVEVRHILNRGIFVIPQTDGTFRVGSNYDNHDATLKVTAKAREELERKLRGLIHCDYAVVDQSAGIRPATKDRKPFIGMHPENETIGVFNGLGTKGVSLSPYWAGRFIDYLEQGKELDKEVNISRYFSLY